MSARALGSTVRLVLVRYAEVMEDRTYLHATLREGAEQAAEIASATLDAAKKVLRDTMARADKAHDETVAIARNEYETKKRELYRQLTGDELR